MQALTLTQPWATLIAIGAKRIETRGWTTRYRGPMAIHAAKGLAGMTEAALRALCYREPFRTALREGGLRTLADLPRGAVVAIATLADVVPTEQLRGELDERERAFGGYGDGRYAWCLQEIQQLHSPTPHAAGWGCGPSPCRPRGCYRRTRWVADEATGVLHWSCAPAPPLPRWEHLARSVPDVRYSASGRAIGPSSTGAAMYPPPKRDRPPMRPGTIFTIIFWLIFGAANAATVIMNLPEISLLSIAAVLIAIGGIAAQIFLGKRS